MTAGRRTPEAVTPEREKELRALGPRARVGRATMLEALDALAAARSQAAALRAAWWTGTPPRCRGCSLSREWIEKNYHHDYCAFGRALTDTGAAAAEYEREILERGVRLGIETARDRCGDVEGNCDEHCSAKLSQLDAAAIAKGATP